MRTLLLLALAVSQGADLDALKARFDAESEKPAAQPTETRAAPPQQFSRRATASEALTKPPTREGYPVARAVARETSEIRIFAWTGLRNYPLKETESLWRDALNDRDALIRAMAMMALSPLKE